MQIQLSDHFDFKRLFRFVLPSIAMMIFTSIYGVVDGLFVSNSVGKTAFAAVNLIMPALMILGALGFMLGAGGSALVAKTLGEGKQEKANRIFSFLVYVALVTGTVLAIIGIIFMRPIAVLLGAEGEMIELCVIYARIIIAALPGYMLQNMFQSFLITAEKPTLGLVVTVVAGVTNMILDALFMAVFQWGIAGAAIATGISQMLGGIIPFLFFCRKNSSLLRLVKTKCEWKALLRTCTNGSSELVSNISLSLVSILYNYQLLRFAGEDGLAAYGVLMYVSFIFVAIFIGYSIGTAPIIGFNYGAQNEEELKNIFKKSMRFIVVMGITLSVTAVLIAGPASELFVGYDRNLCEMTVRSFRLSAASFFFSGFCFFGSSMFTALNNGIVSAIISFARTLVFQILTILVMPEIWGIDGIWYAIAAAEVLASMVAIAYIFGKRKEYRY